MEADDEKEKEKETEDLLNTVVEVVVVASCNALQSGKAN